MILIVVASFEPSEDCKGPLAIIQLESNKWVFTRFSIDETDSFTMGSTQPQSTQFIEEVAKADCAEVYIQQKDFTELVLLADRAITFQSGEHGIDTSRITETVTVPILW